jgi:TonB family protein
MQLMRASMLAIATAWCAAPSPATAAPRHGWTAVGDWEIGPIAPGTCALARHYASGTQLLLRATAGGSLIVALVNEKWRTASSNVGDIRLVLDDDPTRALRPDRSGTMVDVPTNFLARLAVAKSLDVRGIDGAPIERLDPAGAAAAVAALRDCISPAPAHDYGPSIGTPSPPPPPPYSGHGLGRSPRPKMSPATWIDDYPAAALRAGEQGTIAFRLDVDVDGRVTGCTVTASSGSAILDAATCRGMSLHGAFEPARDDDGHPTKGFYSGRVAWRLPAPPPEPPTPPPPH